MGDLPQDGRSLRARKVAITIHSKIGKGDYQAFWSAADRIKKLTKNRVNGVPFIQIELDSQGGDVVEATEIGRLIHDRFMITIVKPNRVCASACVFVLIAGVVRVPTYEARIGLHRPSFDPSHFANLSPEQARAKYNSMLESLRRYFLEMGGQDDAFRLMLSIPSDRIRFLSSSEVDAFGLSGQDSAWEELSNAKMINQYGRDRWSIIKRCTAQSGDHASCEKRAYDQFPAR